MSTKLIALGNTLMKDDGIGIVIAKRLESFLNEMDIEVILGETDFDSCILKIKQEDRILLLDASCFGKTPGDITIFSLEDIISQTSHLTHHNLSLLHLLKLYFPKVKGKLIAIEVSEIDFSMGISNILEEKLGDICEQICTLVNEEELC